MEQTEQERTKKEYKSLLIKYYTENHSFIEKAIFTVTASSITFLLNYAENISDTLFIWYVYSVVLFLLTLILQLISAVISREGCDLGLNIETQNKADKCFYWSRFLNNTFLVTFCLSVIFISVVLLLNSHDFCKSTKKVYQYEQRIKTSNYELYRKEEMYNEKETNSK